MTGTYNYIYEVGSVVGVTFGRVLAIIVSNAKNYIKCKNSAALLRIFIHQYIIRVLEMAGSILALVPKF